MTRPSTMPTNSTYAHIDLFSGIGGFALAARWNGIKTVQFCEKDLFCQKVLNKNFPGVPIHDDIKTFDGTKHAGQFILTGGFPCQPFSCAGKRRGKDDDRYLWPEMLRVISEAKPDWIIGENVSGFVNMALDECVSNLEGEGYEVEPIIIPACGVGAPHRRDRVWIVAHTQAAGREAWGAYGMGAGEPGCLHASCPDRHTADTESEQVQPPESGRLYAELGGTDSNVPNAIGEGLQGGLREQSLRHTGQLDRGGSHEEPDWSENWPEVATRLCRVDDGLPRQVDRVNRLKSLGNAIVPQIAYEIMRCILATERNQNE